MPMGIYHQLRGFSIVDLEAVLLAPVHRTYGQFSVLPVIPINDEVNYSRVIRELMQEALGGAVREKERGRHAAKGQGSHSNLGPLLSAMRHVVACSSD